SSLEAIASSKDAQRNKQLADSTTKALDAIKEQDQLPDPEIVFAPLQLASRSTNVQLTTTALDCIGKLISYSYFSVPSNPPEGTEEGAEPVPPLIERAIDTICNCFQGETTAVEIQLQIVKSLLAAVLNDKIVVHGAGLLKAVRQVYNVFLLSRSTANQQVAQGTLTQMVGTVFERVKTRLHMKEARLNLEHLKHGASNATFDQADTPNGANDNNDRDESPAEHSEAVNASAEPPESGAKLTLKDLEHRKSFDDSNLGDGPTMNSKSGEPTSFLQAIKFYLCLSITRNGASSVDRIFNVSSEIFWLMIKYMRADFKKEIEVTAPLSQKLQFVTILNRLCADPKALTFSTTPLTITTINEQVYEEMRLKTTPASEWQLKATLPPPLTVAHIAPHQETEPDYPKEYAIKRLSIEALVETLRSMVNWSAPIRGDPEPPRSEKPRPQGFSRPSTDDPDQLEKEKARKTALMKGINQFNFKPKKGIQMLLRDGFIPSDSPKDIAEFLIKEDKLDKAQIGEYLGEGDQKNIDIMHAFVDTMEFAKRRFVDSLRQFLQSFRLPGEAQKIDRFMLKFAERYVLGNPNAFANADTAYVLAYSVILLNTDLHSVKIAKRMSKEEFIKNNRGINDNADLPDEYLLGIYDEIAANEIVLKSERDAAAAAGNTPAPSTGIAAGLGQALSNVGRDLQREAYMQQSEEIALRSEQLFKDLFKSQRRKAGTKYILATSFKHVSPMFNVTWMSIFSTLSSQIQKSHNLEVNKLCLEGMKLATQIACLFDLSTPREAFMSALKNTTNLNNPQEMLAKNIEALKVVLELGQTEGNVLRESWKDILMCISQLDRLQLISGGVDESAVPDVSKARFLPPQRSETSDSRSSSNSKKATRARAGTASKGFSTEIALESRSDEVIRSVDRIFTNTATLTGESMVYFARALTEVSWDEIKVSGFQRLTSYIQLAKDCRNQLLQHEPCKIRMEQHLGKRFLKPFEHVLANSHNVTVKDMVLRCLIQMIQARGDNIRSGWRTMFGVFTVAARDPHESIVNLAYENVNQVYKTKFGVVISQGAFTDLIVCLTEFSKNLKFQKKSLAALELLKSLIPTMLKTPECPLSQKYNNIPPPDGAMQNSEKRSRSNTSVEEGYWFPVLFAFHDVLMTGEDLEFWDILWRQQLYPIFMVLRSRPEMSNVLSHEELSVWLSTTMIQALRNMITLFTHYFDALEYMLDRFLELLALCICQENDTISRIGSNCLQQLILKNVTKFKPEHWNKLVGAFVELFERTTAYQLFTATAINNTASISPPPNGLEFSSTASGTTPMDETSLKINGKEELEDDHTVPTPSAEDELQTPTADAPHIALEEFKPSSNLQQQPVVVTAARRRFFNRIISRCVLQLLMIETVNELFSNDTVYAHIPSAELLRLMSLLKRSFQFARRFNEDKELRMRLWREGFMKQPPNLLKQESGSAATYISILFRMFADNAPERLESRPAVEDALVPLCKDIVHGYTTLEEESQHRNIVAWRPVVVDVLEGFVTFPEDAFKKHIPDFYPLAVELLTKDLTADLRSSLLLVLRRVGEVGLGIEGMTQAGQRRDSEASRATAEPVGDREADARRML
ncbi:hypothetical protein QL093DRAFT_2386360, partial [Fusarium oxysporum]